MCGIAGILNLAPGAPPDLAVLQRMAAAQRHRGPDGSGIYRDARCGLAHVRLSIIDVATGAQPLSNERGDLWISFNGEIFNYVELRDVLLERGHRFRTRSDTEVIVHAFEEWGEDCFARFNGQWAIALWDAARGRLTLSRDRVGVRPLHWAEHAGRVLFASEVKGLLAGDPGLPRRFDARGIAEVFTFWAALAPRTPFHGIRELPPGTVRTWERGDARERRFWSPQYPVAGEPAPFRGSVEDAAAQVRHTLFEATRLRTVRSDVPVGSYLSGGLDSSVVAALAREVSPGRLQTFSLRFEDSEYDETAWQQRMVERLGAAHHEILVSRADIAAAFPGAVRQAERPILRTAPAPLFLLSKLVRDAGIKVVLTGEGADEVFAGYDLFREGKVRRFWARRPESRLRPLLLDRLYPYLARSPVAQRAIARKFFGRDLSRAAEPGFAHAIRWESAAALHGLFAPGLREELAGSDVHGELLGSLPRDFSRWTPLGQDQYLEIRTLLSGYLLSAQGDRMLMAHSVEGRFPFLDAEVLALAQSLPDSYKLRGLDEKHVLKRAARDLVPDEIARRKKQPYRAPDALSFCGESPPEWADEVMTGKALESAGVFDPAAASALWTKCRARAAAGQLSNRDNMALVGVLSTQLLWSELLRMPASVPALPRTTVIDRLLPRSSSLVARRPGAQAHEEAM
jgi:asparagine synthase (glutamine-hydrolysing)